MPITKRLRRMLVVPVFLFAGASSTTAWAIFSGRARSPVDDRHAARRALMDARAAQALQWAPETVAMAAMTFRIAAREERRQDLTVLPLRNYGTATRLYGESQALSRQALEEASRNVDAANRRARDATDRAARLVDEAEGLARGTGVDVSDRALLAEARRRLTVAGALERRGATERASSEAELAAAKATAFLERLRTRTARFADEAALARWSGWVDETIAHSSRTGGPALVVLKELNSVRLYEDGRLVRTYDADMGRSNLADKLRQGDLATPEGRYFITEKKSGAGTRYYKALALDYPNADDRRRLASAQRSGRVSAAVGPGGLIEIHGEGGRGEDWTDGCVALSNPDMDELFARVGSGTPVTIVGGDGTGRFSQISRAAGHAR